MKSIDFPSVLFFTYAMAQDRDILLKISADYYHWLVQSLPARQDGLFRTYLWLASLCISLNLMLIRYALPQQLYFCSFCILVSLAISFFSLMICLSAMRGRRDISHPDLRAYSDMWDNHPRTASRYMTEQFWEITRPIKLEQGTRGRKLRATTWLLSISFFFLAWAGLLTLDYQAFTLAPKGGDVQMSDEKPEAVEPQAPQPEPERPTVDNGLTTHSDDHQSATTVTVDTDD